MRPFSSTLRLALRQSPAGRSFLSSQTEAAQKRAQDAFTAAQRNAGKAFGAGLKFLGPVAEKAGNMLGCECPVFLLLFDESIALFLLSSDSSRPILSVLFFCLRHLANSSILAYRKPLLYNLSVGRELLKQVYIAERLQPPTNISTIKSAYSTLWSRASNPAYWKDITSSGEIAKVGIYALEAYGIFKVCASACS